MVFSLSQLDLRVDRNRYVGSDTERRWSLSSHEIQGPPPPSGSVGLCLGVVAQEDSDGNSCVERQITPKILAKSENDLSQEEPANQCGSWRVGAGDNIKHKPHTHHQAQSGSPE